MLFESRAAMFPDRLLPVIASFTCIAPVDGLTLTLIGVVPSALLVPSSVGSLLLSLLRWPCL